MLVATADETGSSTQLAIYPTSALHRRRSADCQVRAMLSDPLHARCPSVAQHSKAKRLAYLDPCPWSSTVKRLLVTDDSLAASSDDTDAKGTKR